MTHLPYLVRMVKPRSGFYNALRSPPLLPSRLVVASPPRLLPALEATRLPRTSSLAMNRPRPRTGPAKPTTVPLPAAKARTGPAKPPPAHRRTRNRPRMNQEQNDDHFTHPLWFSGFGPACRLGHCCPGEEWGTLTGRIVYDGKAPAPPAIKVDKDPEVCGKAGLVDESLEVGPSGGLKNALVSLRSEKVDGRSRI